MNIGDKVKNCKHLFVEYQGMQADENDEPFMYLVNCNDCHTTLRYKEDEMMITMKRKRYDKDYKLYGKLDREE